MIIDAHAHLGFDEVFDTDFTEAALLESQRVNGIDITLVQPSLVHDLPTVQAYHDAIADLVRRHRGHFYGIANPNPHLPGDGYEREVRRCIEELGFLGIKLHPFAHGVNPTGRHGHRFFALADRLGVPVIVHTGIGLPWSAPALLDSIATEYSRLPIIVAHAGGMMSAEAAQLTARHENIYLEPSWAYGFHIRDWVHQFGAHRLMLGSDHADNATTELAKFRSLGFSETELGWVLGGTAAKVFGISI